MKKSCLIFILLIVAKSGFPQERPFKINFLNSGKANLSSITGKSDSTGFILKAQNVKNLILAEGYLLANIDSQSFTEDSLQAEIFVGDKYKWLALGTKNIPEELLSRVGYRESDFQHQHFSPKNFKKLVNKLLEQFANSGYPFANLQLKGIEVDADMVSGILTYEPGPIIYYDSLTITPNNFIKHNFLENYLSTKKGKLFQLKRINEIENSINRLPYALMKDSVLMRFENNLCNIHLSLKPVKANKIDALIGLLPNQKQDNGLLITGYLNLKLQNLFKSGKELSFIWRQYQQESQKLKFHYRHPNLLNSRLGFKVRFDLLKQDSSFLTTDFGVEAFTLYRNIELSFISSFKSSNSLSKPLDSLTLPLIADFKLQQFGARIVYSNILAVTNPLRGSGAFLDFRLGSKQISRRSGVADVVYDSINLNSLQIDLSFGGEYNQRVSKLFVIHADITLASIFNKDDLFANDLLRLGGVNSLRGFNDLDLFVSSYVLLRLEPRLILNESSRLFLFYDQAFTNNSRGNLTDQPRGFGAGLMLDTGNGDLQLVYGLGVSGQQSLSLAQSKIHIGYVARF